MSAPQPIGGPGPHPSWSASGPGSSVPGPAVPPQYRAPSNGVSAWLQFLWLYLPIPALNVAAWVAGCIVARSSARTSGSPVAIANARHALNWALSYLVVVGGLAVLVAVVGVTTGVFFERAGVSQREVPVLLVTCYVAWIVSLLVYGILALIHGIAGAVAANRGRVYRPLMTFPFLKPDARE